MIIIKVIANLNIYIYITKKLTLRLVNNYNKNNINKKIIFNN